MNKNFKVNTNRKINNSPICLFTFNRLNELIITVEALNSNYLAKETDLYIFSDGPRSVEERKKVEEVRIYINSITGFKNINIKYNKENKGLASSIIDGVTEVLRIYDSAIIVEDDLISSPNFLNFMNQSLDFYKSDKSILSISGYTFDLKSVPLDFDYYFGVRSATWGWATWSDRWFEIDWQIKDAESNLKTKDFRRRFLRGGSDMIKMLNDQRKGKINSWAIRFCYHQSKSNLYTVFPSISKIRSIGFSKEATHTYNSNRFYSKLDDGAKVNFEFRFFSEIDKKIEKDFRRKFSIWVRIKSKLIQKFKSK